MSELEHKAFPIELKAVDIAESTFEGYSAGIGNVDTQDDRIDPGAFKKTIRERVGKGAVKMLNGHSPSDTQNVWGFVMEAEEQAFNGRGKKDEKPTHVVWTKFQVSRASAAAQEALGKVEEGILDALSIGFRVIKVEYEPKDGGDFQEEADPIWEWYMGRALRIIKELQWWETSLVTWGANDAAVVLPGTVKSLLTQVEQAGRGNLPEEEVRQAIMGLSRLLKDQEKAAEVLRCLATAKEVDRAATHLEVVPASAAIPTRDQGAIEALCEAARDILEEVPAGASYLWNGVDLVPQRIPDPDPVTLAPDPGVTQIEDQQGAAPADSTAGDPAAGDGEHYPSQDRISVELALLDVTSMQLEE